MKIINWTIAILSTSLLFLVLLNIKKCNQEPNYNYKIEQLDKTIDSLKSSVDTIIEYETKTKWRTKTIKEVEYIYLVADTMQPIIRDSLRTRYHKGR